MTIHVRSRHLEIDLAVRAYAERRLRFRLGRLTGRVGRVTVQLDDLNGPRGGADKACRVRVRFRPGRSVFVEDRDADLLTAIDRATERAARAIARAIERLRDRRVPGVPAAAGE